MKMKHGLIIILCLGISYSFIAQGTIRISKTATGIPIVDHTQDQSQSTQDMQSRANDVQGVPAAVPPLPAPSQSSNTQPGTHRDPHTRTNNYGEPIQ